MEIVLPYNYAPRDYQLPVWEYFQNGGKRAVCVWHRRAGKDLNAIHLLCCKAHQRIGTYWHVFPTYKQGKKIAWDGKRKDGIAFRDAFPPELVQGVNHTEMKVTFKNGSVYQIIGADKPDSLVGANPIGIVYSEWSIMNPSVREYLRPILSENEGWELFIYTSRGKNHGWKTFKRAQGNPDWFAESLTIDDTQAIGLEAVEADRADGMSEEMIQQEYWCSFNTPVEGSYFGDFITALEHDGRYCRVPYEPTLPVHTVWDLGVGDDTDIIFYQLVRNEIRLIDHYHGTGEGIQHYAKVIKEKDYSYGEHWAPHDIKVREFGNNALTRYEIARTLGIRFNIIKKQSFEDGISAVRAILPRVYADDTKCEYLMECLKQYHKKWDDVLKVFSVKEERDWSVHAAAAMRYLALVVREDQATTELPRSAVSHYNPHTYDLPEYAEEGNLIHAQ